MSRPTGSGSRQRRSLTLAAAAALVALLAPPAHAAPNPVTVGATTPQGASPIAVTFSAPDPGTTTHLWRGDGPCSVGNALGDTGVSDNAGATQLTDAGAIAEHHYCY